VWCLRRQLHNTRSLCSTKMFISVILSDARRSAASKRESKNPEGFSSAYGASGSSHENLRPFQFDPLAIRGCSASVSIVEFRDTQTRSQPLFASSSFSHTPATYPDDDVLRKNASFLRTHSRSSEAAVTCDPNGRPLTTGVQAVSGFPIQSGFSCPDADPPAPLPSDPASLSHRREAFVNRQSFVHASDNAHLCKLLVQLSVRFHE
jgi:hypothetical protein